MINSRIQLIVKFCSKHKIYIGMVLISTIVLFLRRPDAILNAQFWAEDGAVWYQYAYNNDFSLTTLAEPYAGYLGTFPRLVSIFSGAVGVAHAPLFFSLVALSVQLIPVMYVWGSRFEKLVPSKVFRVYLTAAYLLLPYTAEIHANVTNSQWFLAVVAFLIVFLPEAKSLTQKLLDNGILIIACLSGPFSIFLLFILGLQATIYRNKQIISRNKFIILGLAASIQLLVILLGHIARENSDMGISISTFSVIIGGQIFGAGILGWQSIKVLTLNLWVTPLITALGSIFIIYVLWKAPKMLKAFVVYATLVLMVTLLFPNGAYPNLTWWETLGTPQAGGRYFYLAHLALLISIGWFYSYHKSGVVKVCVGVLVAVALLFGVRTDFRHSELKNYNYDIFVNRYKTAQQGEKIQTEIAPGFPWQVEIYK